MNALLILLLLLTGFGVVSLLPEQGSAALVLCGTLAFVCGAVATRVKDDRVFLLRLLAIGLILRVALATVINLLNLHEFFGPDSFTYDLFGYDMQQTWEESGFEISFGDVRNPNYGMGVMVALIYSFTGRSLLAVQFTNAVFGAATALMIYLCARHIFESKRVARLSALCVAFFPSLVLWSAQGLKDAPIVFFITVVVFSTLKLAERLSFGYLIALVASLLGILSMRFYIFYMAVVAVAGALLIGTQRMQGVSVLRQFAVVMMIALALAYVGVRQTASAQFEAFANLDRIQRTREALASSNRSKGETDAGDVTTASGALTAVPISMVNLLFAPFPWQLTNLRQAITLPEMIVWWSMFPLLALGVWFTLKFRVRQAFVILLFSSMLTLGYSVFQGNVGAAYRQRSQLLVFYFIFVAVGYVLWQERREEQKRQRNAVIGDRQLEIARARRKRSEDGGDVRVNAPRD